MCFYNQLPSSLGLEIDCICKQSTFIGSQTNDKIDKEIVDSFIKLPTDNWT